MSAVLTRVELPDGSAWQYLDSVGTVQGLDYEWTYPGGPASATFSIDAPANAQISALRVGSRVTMHRGATTVWAGRVAEVDRDGWRVTCDGLGSLATHEAAATTGTIDGIVDAAIADGLLWTRPATLGAASWAGGDGGEDVGQTKLDEVLNDTLLTIGKRWTVDTRGVVAAVSDPTTPTLIVRADTAPPLTLNDYATHVTARYFASRSAEGFAQYATVKVANTAAAGKFGRVNRSIDITGLGMKSSGQAAAIAQQYLDRVSPRMTVSGDFVVQPGQVTTETGAAVDLAHLKPGVVARIQLVSLVRDALLVPTTSVDMLIGTTSYDADSNTATLSPAHRALDALQEMFTGRARTRVKVTDE